MPWDITAEELGNAVPNLEWDDIKSAWPHLDLDAPISAKQLAALDLLDASQLIAVLTGDDDDTAYQQRRKAVNTRAEFLAVRDARLAELMALRSEEGAT